MLPHQQFPESNIKWLYDQGFDLLGHCVFDTDGNGDPLTHADGSKKVKLSISKWALSKEDLQFVNQYGYIYLSVVGGQPPVSLFAEPLFNEVEFTPLAEQQPKPCAPIKPMKSGFSITSSGKDCCVADMLGIDDEQEQQLIDMLNTIVQTSERIDEIFAKTIEKCETDNEVAFCLMSLGIGYYNQKQH